MNIPIAGKEYKLISTNQEGIYIDYANPELPCIYAHALLSLADVIQYVKEYKPAKFISSKEELNVLEYVKLNLFDQLYPVKIYRTGKQKAYLKQSIIHYFTNKNTDISKPTFIKKIQEAVFYETMITMISKWEEELQLMSNELIFKKLKTKPFLVDLETKNIVFNKNNQLLNLRTNEYIVYLAVQALKPSSEVTLAKTKHYFPDHEQLLKRLKHEYPGI